MKNNQLTKPLTTQPSPYRKVLREVSTIYGPKSREIAEVLSWLIVSAFTKEPSTFKLL